MFGYAGKILHVDLSKGKIEARETPEKLARAFIGGRGLGAALLYKELRPGIDPLSPDNVLIFATGPATGTPLPACARWEAVTKSPLTNMYLCCSAGSFMGAELKFAGYDGLVIRGKAEKPAWLNVVDSKVEIRDAGELWGETAEDAQIAIQKELKDRRAAVASIGQAGENLVKFATIQIDMHSIGRGGSLGRGGAGAVMGSKRLKAISVRGHGRVEVADEGELMTFVRELAQEIKTNELAQRFSRWGTTQFVGPVNEAGMWPTRNFQRGSFEGASKLSAETFRKQLVKRDTACYACTIASGKCSVVAEGPYADTIVKGPEYETIWSLGANCGVDRLDAIAAAAMWCDRYGLDTISAGNVIGFTMECYERGLLEKKSTDGLDLRFGNHEVLIPLIRKIALRAGMGDLLADGVRLTAKKIGKGVERLAMHVKGMELPAYDPRGAWGMALAYSTACRGGCHLKAWTLAAEVFAPKYDRFSIEGKAKMVFDMQNTRAVVDSLGVCVFGTRAIGVDEMVRILALTTGRNLNAKELHGAGERIYTLERLLAVRDGISRKDDTLPSRFFDEPLPEHKEHRLTREHMDKMLDEYYSLRGWDNDGKPKGEKLRELAIIEMS